MSSKNNNQNMQTGEDNMNDTREMQTEYYKKMEYEKKVLSKLRYRAKKKGLKITKGLSASFIPNPFPEKDAHAYIAEKKYAIKDGDGHLIAGFEEAEGFIKQQPDCTGVSHADNAITGR